MTDCKIIAIAGGSCSGKTTIASNVAQALGPDHCAVVYQDNYYRGHADITNYDVPEAIEFELMAEHLAQLQRGNSVAMPCYDFTTHRRRKNTLALEPKPVILVDGILILHAEELRNSFDFKVFVECDEVIRRQRRLLRDTMERGRSVADIIEQFDSQVAPLHNHLVEPSKQFADLICQQTDQHSSCDYQALLDYCQQLLPV